MNITLHDQINGTRLVIYDNLLNATKRTKINNYRKLLAVLYKQRDLCGDKFPKAKEAIADYENRLDKALEEFPDMREPNEVVIKTFGGWLSNLGEKRLLTVQDKLSRL